MFTLMLLTDIAQKHSVTQLRCSFFLKKNHCTDTSPSLQRLGPLLQLNLAKETINLGSFLSSFTFKWKIYSFLVPSGHLELFK